MPKDIQYQNMVSIFTEKYLGKLYYYCLKKTGNVTEAEDLSSDISLNIIAELNKGVIPQHFSAWVWTIAKNRYSHWADRKNKQRGRIAHSGLDDENLTDEACTEAELVRAEDLNLMRRELSFIAKDYREIVVAYYIDDLKVQTIAHKTKLPEGTVMSKLFRARKILKEGMAMAREFGTKSYKPEFFVFKIINNPPTAFQSILLSRRLPQNILLEAHANPSTMEELAVEVGVALPYMEEEIANLLATELIMETKGKYVTSFLIASKELQLEVYNVKRKGSKERSRIIAKIVSDILPQFRELGIVQSHYKNSDLKWLAVSMFADLLIYIIEGYGVKDVYKRRDGSDWGVIGYEHHNLIPEIMWVGQVYVTAGEGRIATFTYDAFEMYKNVSKLPRDHVYASFLLDVIANKRNVNSFSPSEKALWGELNGKFVREGENGNVLIDIAVFTPEKMGIFQEILRAQPEFAELTKHMADVFADVKMVLKQHSYPAINDQLSFYASVFMFDTQGMVINDLVEAGELVVPEDVESSLIGVFAELKEGL